MVYSECEWRVHEAYTIHCTIMHYHTLSCTLMYCNTLSCTLMYCHALSYTVLFSYLYPSSIDDEFGYLAPCQPSGEVADVISFQSPSTTQFESTGNATRGEDVLPLTSVRNGHTFTESIGGRPAAAARWSVGSPPARVIKVPYQSIVYSAVVSVE
jgi:hypothetical protein